MPLIKTRRAIFEEDAIVSVEHHLKPNSERTLLISLINGHTIKLENHEAKAVWMRFCDKLGDISLIVDAEKDLEVA